MKFTEFNLHPSLLEGLHASRFTDATPIQEKCIPPILEGKDLLGTAQTGTGKTGAFVIPMLQKLIEAKDQGAEQATRVLILTPTRELASQIDEQIFALGYHTGVHSAIVIGGSDFSQQAKSMQGGVDVVVATPGRLLDQMNVLQLSFDKLQYLVLDEADRMLDMGFLPDVKNILRKLPTKRQSLMFSATFPPQIQKLTAEFMNDPVRVNVATSKAADTIRQEVYQVYEADKVTLLKHLFKNDLKGMPAIVFTATKRGTDQLNRTLNKHGIGCMAMHGDRTQEEREHALREFSTGKINILVATDVIARGIDIQDVGVIINYDCPKSVDDYIHRIGRTGRNEKSGRAITLVSPRDSRLYKSIKDRVGKQLNELQVPDVVLEELKSGKNDGPRNQRNDRNSSRGGDRDRNSRNYEQDDRGRRPQHRNEDRKYANDRPERPQRGERNERNERSDRGYENKRVPANAKIPEPNNPKDTAKDARVKERQLPIIRFQSASERLKPGAKPVKGWGGLVRALFGL